jgi:hypothetical protein
MPVKEEIEVCENLKLTELEILFSDLFPFLVLEVYQSGEPVSEVFKSRNLAQLSKRKAVLPFRITPALSVRELEKLFWDHLGIKIAVFRKVGSSLLETTFTSDWTLRHQNEKGVQIQNDFNVSKQSS